tara:strand:+ start:36 stop:698 length:663 start_codon:yes stop_codon:yes gene_type:complete
MSRILVDQVRSNSASGDAITLDGNGKCAINATTINSLTFPTSDGSADQIIKTNGSGALSFTTAAAGITMADSWRVHSNFSGDAVPIASNWERADLSPWEGNLGTGLTESSGVFTFPATGYYYISWSHYYYGSGDSPWNELGIGFSNDSGSNWTEMNHTEGWYERGGTAYTKQSSDMIMDITNVSTQRIRFRVDVDNNNTVTLGNTARTHTGFYIIRLGDT